MRNKLWCPMAYCTDGRCVSGSTSRIFESGGSCLDCSHVLWHLWQCEMEVLSFWDSTLISKCPSLVKLNIFLFTAVSKSCFVSSFGRMNSLDTTHDFFSEITMKGTCCVLTGISWVLLTEWARLYLCSSLVSSRAPLLTPINPTHTTSLHCLEQVEMNSINTSGKIFACWKVPLFCVKLERTMNTLNKLQHARKTCILWKLLKLKSWNKNL